MCSWDKNSLYNRHLKFFWHDRSVKGLPPVTKDININRQTSQSCVCVCVNVYFTITISFTLLKLAGLCFTVTPALLLTPAHVSTCTYETKHELTHAPLSLLLSSSTWEIDTLKKPFTVKSFYSIRSFTSLFMLHLSFFCTWPVIMKECKWVIDGSDGAV